VLDRLIAAARAGESRVLVVRGEPGVGKTALLDDLAEQAPGCRVAHAAGVQSEMEPVYAGLHQLLTPMLGRLERLPVPRPTWYGRRSARRGGSSDASWSASQTRTWAGSEDRGQYGIGDRTSRTA